MYFQLNYSIGLALVSLLGLNYRKNKPLNSKYFQVTCNLSLASLNESIISQSSVSHKHYPQQCSEDRRPQSM